MDATALRERQQSVGWPSLTDLLGGQVSVAQLGLVGGWISTVGLLGWAIGGFVFGMLADYIGRVRTLTISIVIYSVFTALQGFSQAPWQLGLFRFMGGLGTGQGRAWHRGGWARLQGLCVPSAV